MEIELQISYTTIKNFFNWANWNPQIWISNIKQSMSLVWSRKGKELRNNDPRKLKFLLGANEDQSNVRFVLLRCLAR